MKDTSMEAQRQVIIKWLHKTLNAEIGEEYYLNVHAKDEQKRLTKAFKDEIKILSKIDPIGASQLYVFSIFKDKRFWVVIRKVAISLTVGFKKVLDGSLVKEELEDNAEEVRRYTLMRRDHMSWKDIEETEGPVLPSIKEKVDG